MYLNMSLPEYLRILYGVNHSSVDFVRHVQPLYGKLGFQSDNKEILIHGLIAMALGSYTLFDPKLMELANATISQYSPLI